eukprot:gene22800-28962_t
MKGTGKMASGVGLEFIVQHRKGQFTQDIGSMVFVMATEKTIMLITMDIILDIGKQINATVEEQ